MQHIFDKLPDAIKQIILMTTADNEWGVFLEFCIRDKNEEMAELSTDCDAHQFQRKYLALKAQRQQFLDFLDLLEHFKQQRQN